LKPVASREFDARRKPRPLEIEPGAKNERVPPRASERRTRSFAASRTLSAYPRSSRIYFFAGVLVVVVDDLVSVFDFSSVQPRIDRVKQRVNSIAVSFFIDVFLNFVEFIYPVPPRNGPS
jgi:hypothetical protein